MQRNKIFMGAITVLLILCVLVAVLGAGCTTRTTVVQQNEQEGDLTASVSTLEPTSSPTRSLIAEVDPSRIYDMHQTATIDDFDGSWEVRVSSVSYITKTSNKYADPKPGYQYCVVGISIQNCDSVPLKLTSFRQFTLVDSEGKRQSEGWNVFLGIDTDRMNKLVDVIETIDAGEWRTGYLAYEVEEGATGFKLAFRADGYNSNAVFVLE